MRKKYSVLITGVVGATLLGVFLHHNSGDRATTTNARHDASKGHLVATYTTDGKAPAPLPPPQQLKPVTPWDFHKPLTADEKKEFEAVEAQVQKFLTWGKLDAEVVSAFRQTLFKMGDRAIANLARELSHITQDDIKNKADAEAIVQKIDALAYFANSQNPLAADSAEHLAKRPIIWNESGELQNPVEANITFEMFDIFSRFRQGEAAEFIAGIDKKHRTAYFTRYAYGRKLAGKTMEEIDQELKAVFGSPELALK